MTSEEVKDFILNRVNSLDNTIEFIEPDHFLEANLGLDSLDRIELWFDLSDRSKIEISDGEMSKLRTVGDVVEFFKEK